ncbi:PIN domain-containing protein [Rhizobium laguerreae]|uniref:hypothetical protein n=1 Tax=Rhizobium laguerreae TaxID=1076926 RepID=UPI001C8FCA06|nr:hypothetical protein [Rhizobium laguerreae]MBY3154463.1 PIN domain-containing protein [Rhizobium laguerreae]
MIFYLDTGLFIDYLTPRGHRNSGLRTADRRGRTVDDIFKDSEQLLEHILKKSIHQAVTSALTYYEVEEALFKQLSMATKGISHASIVLVPMARSIVAQMNATVRYYGIGITDLTAATIEAQGRERELDIRGIRAADSLHVVTAMSIGAEVLVSSDDAVLSLDAVLTNAQGRRLRCVDSDIALTLI